MMMPSSSKCGSTSPLIITSSSSSVPSPHYQVTSSTSSCKIQGSNNISHENTLIVSDREEENDCDTIDSDECSILYSNTNNIPPASTTTLYQSEENASLMGFVVPQNTNAGIPSKQHAECPICFKVLRDKYKVKTHIADVHSNVQHVFNCPVCNRVYKTKNTLANHISLTHRGYK